MDDSGNGKIEPEELLYGLRDQGVEIERTEVEQIMLHFDKDGDGNVVFDEFLRALRGKMNQRRKNLVKLAFGQLDKTGDGVVTMEDLMSIYDVSENPDVINGILTPDQAFQEFAKVWDRDRSGSIHLDEFIDYYQDVSASIDNDDYFELMIRSASGTSPAARPIREHRQPSGAGDPRRRFAGGCGDPGRPRLGRQRLPGHQEEALHAGREEH